MTYPLGERPDAKHLNPVYQRVLSHFPDEWATRLDIEQMFVLIDGALPFEACLYYQILPLYLQGSRLTLGMVSPTDTAALDYVRRIISYLNYSLVPRAISSEALQASLTAYLNHIGNNPAIITQRQQFFTRPQRHSARARAEQKVDVNDQRTLIVDSPEELNVEGFRVSAAQAHVEPPPPMPFNPATPTPSPPADPPADHPDLPLDPTDGLVDETVMPDLPSPPEPIAAAPPQPEISQPPPASPPLLHPLPQLNIQAQYLTSPVEVLTALAPPQLLQELLGRVLVGGIGRLYFERQPQHGRVLWSQNGVLQSVMDKLDSERFQGVINELKLMTRVPLIAVEQPRNVEIERLYQQTRLLLRFRFIPGKYGEEATIQVLRGAALKFYQKQQLTNLERDALTIAKQLQLKVNEIRDRTQAESGAEGGHLESLPALSQLLRNIEDQLDTLGLHDSPALNEQSEDD